MNTVELIIIAVILVYMLIPNVYYRNFSDKVIKRFSTKDKVVALTFDDGPDPRYTPELLDLLRLNNIKCTFFVLADKAKEYPELIKRISEEGHYIGLHYFKHMNALFRNPSQTKNDFQQSVNIMNTLGIKVHLFRPPWGIFNALTFHFAKEYDFKVILWSIHAMDWSRWTTVDRIKQKLVSRVRPGDIILLHDGRGANDAPKRTISALKTVIPALKKRGFNFVLAKDM